VIGSEPEIYFTPGGIPPPATFTLIADGAATRRAGMQHEMIPGNRDEPAGYLCMCPPAFMAFPARLRPRDSRLVQAILGRGYELTGFVHRNSAGEVECFWADAATAI